MIDHGKKRQKPLPNPREAAFDFKSWLFVIDFYQKTFTFVQILMIMAKKKEWQEGEIMVAFNLTKLDNSYTPVMTELVLR